jgi:hypothetical protein
VTFSKKMLLGKAAEVYSVADDEEVSRSDYGA